MAKQGVPSVNSPLVDANGTLSQPWYQFFVALAAGLGGQLDFGTAPPTTGTWTRGSIRFNSAPSIGQPKGWQCTVTGTPGTWVSMGNL